MDSPPRASLLRGFSLLEVIVALGLLAVGATAVLALYIQNLRAARQAKEQIALTLLKRDLRAKTQLAALTAFTGSPPRSIFQESAWLLRDSSAPDDPGAPAALDGGTTPAGSTAQDALNGQQWEAVRQRYDEISGPGGAWDANPLYANFQFRMRTVLPPEAENNQFVDWDGYDIWDAGARRLLPNIYSSEIEGEGAVPAKKPAVPAAAPFSSRGTAPPGAAAEGYFGPPRPSHGVVLDPRGFRFHAKRIQCVIGWDLNNSKDIFSGQHETFYFSVYNPGLRRDR